MKSILGWTTLWLIVLAAPMAGAQDQGWGVYRADDYGFSMLMPIGTSYEEREYGGGWAELRAEYDGVKFYALVKLGENATAEEIERLGVDLTGIPDRYWSTIDKGRDENGWVWYRTVEASSQGRLVVGGYGIGRRGSYLLILETTERDYRDYKSDYKDWYNSIHLY